MYLTNIIVFGQGQRIDLEIIDPRGRYMFTDLYSLLKESHENVCYTELELTS